MTPQKISAEFNDVNLADSTIGRLEVLGVPPPDIIKSAVGDNRISVTANVEDRLLEKALLILKR